ncbi:hypothetical protein EI427_24265 [Flammeovirga pectinis]|uniref:Peptidase S9A N-terminal domain-containing protein n=1 Tax=Flammeovirga pectinis TaxID=2494373 RepID=A0A3Q9FQK1_9BACT|nr:hypothetical protein [Flammeovirga pectinis]AZQ65331.1 hypothetical protein EI427_24265 [Flammeovirga pectinis]
MINKITLLFTCLLFLSIDIIFAQSYPTYKKERHETILHGDTLVDDYFWMRNRKKEIKKKLTKENEFFENAFNPTSLLVDSLYNEMLQLTNLDRKSLPVFKNGYWYLTTSPKDKDFPIYKRWKENETEADAKVFFDCNIFTQKFKAYITDIESISPNGKYIAFSVDKDGSDIKDLYILEVKTQKILKDHIKKVSTVLWANDNATLFYTKDDNITNRTNELYKHQLGNKTDILLFNEKDATYNLDIYKSKSQDYIFLASISKSDNKISYINANLANSKFKELIPLSKNIEHNITQAGEYFYDFNNTKGNRFALYKTSIDSINNWVEIYSPKEGEYIDDVIPFLINCLVLN